MVRQHFDAQASSNMGKSRLAVSGVDAHVPALLCRCNLGLWPVLRVLDPESSQMGHLECSKALHIRKVVARRPCNLQARPMLRTGKRPLTCCL